METPIKLRLLSSCLSLKKKSFSELGPYFQTLLDKARTDEDDEWVRVISNLLSVYPGNNGLKTEITATDDNNDALAKLFQETLEQFKNSTFTSQYFLIIVVDLKSCSLQPLIQQYQNQPTRDGLLPNNHFSLKKEAQADLLEPLNFLDQLEQKERDKTVNSNGNEPVNTSDAHVPNRIKKRPQPLNAGNNNASNPARKLSSADKPLQRKTSIITKPSQPQTPGSALVSPRLTPKPVKPRAAVIITDDEAKQKMLEQSDNEKRRANYIRTDKDPDRERKRLERLQAKEKKDAEREEKKKSKEIEKKRKLEETETMMNARKRVKEDPNKRQPPRPSNMPQMPTFFNNTGARAFMSPFGMPGASPTSSPFANMMVPFSPTSGGVQFNVINNPTTPTTAGAQNKMTQMLQEVLNQQTPPTTAPIASPLQNFTPTQGLPAPPSIRFNNPPTPTSGGQPRMPFMYFPQGSPGGPTVPPVKTHPNGMTQPNLQQQIQQKLMAITQTQPQHKPEQQPLTPTPNTAVSAQQRKQQLEEYLDKTLLKGCNKVSQSARQRIMDFLSGKIDINELPPDQIEEQQLIHEETKDNSVVHQIYFKMDHKAKTWKILKKY
jgi:hypothetical protein